MKTPIYFTLKSLVWVKGCVNCWWFTFIAQEVHQRCVLVWQCLVYKETHSTAISPTLFPSIRTCAIGTVLHGGGKFSSHIKSEWKKFVLYASSPPSSSQWHWKGKEKVTRHKLRERTRGCRRKSSWSRPVLSPLLALALLAEGLSAFHPISASKLDVLWVTWQSYWCGWCLLVTAFLEATEKQQ